MADYPAQHTIEHKRNDTFIHTITNVLDRDGLPMDWTGVVAFMQVRATRNDPAMIDIATPDQIDLSVNGEISFNVNKSLMNFEGKQYIYDIEFSKDNVHITGISGKFIMYDDVTHD